jgi:PAS domain S-box-containing protein
MFGLWMADSRTSHESPRLLLGLNFTFSTLASLVVAFLAARSYLARADARMLLLGSGVLIWGFGSLLASFLGQGNPNTIVTIHNVSVWLAACVLLSCASLSRAHRGNAGASIWRVGVAYTVALGLVWMVVQTVRLDWLPVFFVQGQGGTLVRQFVLYSAISMLVLSAVLMWPVKGGAWTAFAFWYTMALLLLADGLFGVLMQPVVGSLLGWTGRAAQILGGVCLLVAAYTSAWETGDPELLPQAGRDGPRQKYLVTIAIVAAAAAMRLVFFHSFEMRPPYITFYPAVMFAALYGGLRPGLLATVISTLLLNFFLTQSGEKNVFPDAANLLATAIFVVSGVMVSWITEAMHRARVDLRKSNEELEQRVIERTEKLETANQVLRAEIEQRRQVEEALRGSEERQRLLSETMLQGVVHQDASGRIFAMNPAAEQILGKSREEYLGSSSEQQSEHTIREDGSPFPGGAHPAMEALRLGQRVSGVVMGVYNSQLKERRWLKIDAVPMWRQGRAAPMEVYSVFEDITERRKVEQALRESEQRVLSVLQSASIGTFEVDLQTGEERWNSIEYDLLGLKPDKLSAKPESLFSHVHPDDIDSFKAKWANALNTGELDVEFRVLRADGQERWLAGKGRFVVNSEGKATHFLGINFDVTGRRQVEEYLRRSEALYRSIGESMDFGTWTSDLNGRNTYASNNFLTLTGLSQEQLSELDWSGIVEPVDAPRAKAQWEECVRTGSNWDFEYRIHGVDDQWHYILARGTPVKDERGRILCWAGINLDITRLMRAEEALRQREQQWKVMANAMPQLAWIAQADGYITWYNQRWYDYTGTTPEQMAGWGWEGVHHPAVLPQVLAQWKKSLETGQSFEMEFPLKGADGVFRPFLTRAFPMKDDAGHVLQWLGTNTDIAGRKQAEGTLRDSTLRLQSANNALKESRRAALNLMDDALHARQQAEDLNAELRREVDERKRAEETLHRLNRILNARSSSDQAMMRVQAESDYLKEVCQIVVQDCGFPMAWIGFAEHDEAKSVRPVAWAGFEDGYLETLHITWSDSERGKGPTGTAIRTGKLSLCRNMLTDPQFVPWREEAYKRGYASSIVLPLKAEGVVLGALTIYSRELNPFTEEDVGLLGKLADDLAYGVTALRLREAHRKAELALRESEARYRNLFNTMSEGFALHELICDAEGRPCDYRILEVNPAYERLTGLRGADLVGRTVLEVMPDTEPMWIQRFGRVALTGEPDHFDGESRVLDRWYEVYVSRTEIGRFAVVFLNVTERKKAEEALRRSNDRINLLAETASELLRSDSPLTIINSLCQKVLAFLDCQAFFNFLVDEKKGRLHLNTCAGISDEEARKIEWLDFGMAVCGCVARDACRIVVEDIPAAQDPRADLLKGFGIVAYACHPLMVGKRLLGTLSFGTRTRARFEEDELSLMMAVTDQVAIAIESQRAEEALRLAAEDLARSNRDLEQFAYVASHDLQEPLRAVSGYTQLLQKRYPDQLDEKGRQYIAGAADGAIRMQTLIHDLLSFSRVSTQGKSFELTDLNVVLAKALDNLAVTLQEASPKVTSGVLPRVRVDPTQITQLFQNLIGNAIKFRNNRPLEIDISARRETAQWVLSVRDNGIGIEPQYFERIFQIFQRLHTRVAYPGTGIGLAVCKRIVERHGGTIWVESQPGAGSTFHFTIGDNPS